ncbi:BtpA/SgcQ family protein [Terrisporobacter glycolicus]|uniref:Membrane biogenesis protein n=1 Tax=Terrisporobacter glycolicus ATCC 14880 = DSM 1288 TaxID=1121315 RepID=A0ABZ2EZ58_9FIRM|nr:BtpA/SgcQ family protein [Terrisporobacter glycolicus]
MGETKGILSVFKNKKPIIAMVHLKGDTPEEIFERAKKEIHIFEENGVDGIMLENYYGNYYDLERILEYVSISNLSIPYGVNCLNVDAMGFELANRYNASYIQVDSVVGHVKPRDEATLEEFFKLYRRNCKAYLIGGVRFKYQPVLSEKTVEEDLQIGMTRCDAIAVTENATGEETSMEKIELFKKNLGDFPLVIAAGVTLENAKKQLEIGDIAIVGSYFKDTFKDTGDVSEDHVKTFMNEIKKMREEL